MFYSKSKIIGRIFKYVIDLNDMPSGFRDCNNNAKLRYIQFKIMHNKQVPQSLVFKMRMSNSAYDFIAKQKLIVRQSCITLLSL